MTYSTNNSEAIILARMQANVTNDIEKTEGSLVYDALSPASKEFAASYKSLDEVKNKMDISNLTGDELTARVYERTGIPREEATYAEGSLDIIGTGTIKEGDLFQTPGGIQFKSTEAKTIINTGTVNIKAVVAGSTGNIPANQIIIIPVAINGIISVSNSLPTSGGYDEETDAHLLEKYYEKLQNPDTGGNIAHFKNLVKSYTGVGDCKVFPTWNGNYTIKIVIIDSNKEVPSTDLVNEVQNYMDPLGDNWGLGYGAAPAFSHTIIEGASDNIIGVEFTVVKDTNYTDEQRLANIQASITEYLKSLAFVDDAVVSYAKIGATILSSKGVQDYSDLTVNGGTSNIFISLTSELCEIPKLGTVTINV